MHGRGDLLPPRRKNLRTTLETEKFLFDACCGKGV